MNVIEVNNLNKTYNISPRLSFRTLLNPKRKNTLKKNEFLALNDVSFSVQKGSILGIIGRNGSGKSTLLRILLGSIKPDNKEAVKTIGKVIKLSMGTGFNQQLAARENIYINGSILGLSFKEIGDIFYDILDFAGLREFVDTPIKYYSNGMKKKLAFSLAIRTKADIILLDEFFGGVGDLEFQDKAFSALKSFLSDNKTAVFVSHSPALIKKNCDQAMWLEKGQIKDLGNPETVVKNYVNFIKKLKHEKS